MNRITAFMKAHEEELFQRFRSQYVGQVDPSVFDELNKALVSEELVTFYRSIFPKLKDELHFLRKKQKELEDRIKERGLGENDPERKELQSEIRDLRGLAMGIQRRNTLEHLTNVGALPNYAFPESGVKLAARVMGRSVEGGTQPPLNQEFEIVRGASTAIRELAPDNLFYSQGFKFKVTGVNTFEWADKDNLHEKRFCSECDHIEQASTAPAGPCPKCGSATFGAASNVHKFARMTSVRSYNDSAGATLSDAKDEREKTTYNTQWHFHFDAQGSRGGYAMKEIPFGIEFVKNVRITSTNLGGTKAVNARKSTVNEREVATHGFVTCRHCGRSTSDPRAMDNKVHYGYCKHKEDAYSNAPNEVFEELFFYREVTTEAMKILLPVQEFNTEAEVKMFLAGIQLGLKKYYRGKPDHIHLAAYKEYNQRTSRFDRYLVLYDAVPGGTGYLEKLFATGEFNRLLHVAYETIRDCGCQHQGKDGCYRCIFSYGNQYHREELSRAASEAWFKKIVDKSGEWEFQPDGLGKITNTGQIEESELEHKFIRALRNYSKRNDAWDFEQVNENGTISYKLRYGSGETSFAYHIRPQVPLGATDNIEHNTTPDFLVTCTEGKLKDRKLTKPMLKAIPKIAVYLDGYMFHASPENNRFMDDVSRRMGLINSGKFLTWSLTWADMERFEKVFEETDRQTNREDALAIKLKEPGFVNTARALLQANKAEVLDIHLAKNSMERLLELLKHPVRDEKFDASWSLFLGLFQRQMFVPSFAPADKKRAYGGLEQSDRHCLDNKTLDGWVVFQGLAQTDLFNSTTIVNIAEREVESRLVFRNVEAIEKEEWNVFWMYWNVMQMKGLQVGGNEEAE
jgi:DEAD/DEAH box helicase domain-containing protein